MEVPGWSYTPKGDLEGSFKGNNQHPTKTLEAALIGAGCSQIRESKWRSPVWAPHSVRVTWIRPTAEWEKYLQGLRLPGWIYVGTKDDEGRFEARPGASYGVLEDRLLAEAFYISRGGVEGGPPFFVHVDYPPSGPAPAYQTGTPEGHTLLESGQDPSLAHAEGPPTENPPLAYSNRSPLTKRSGRISRRHRLCG